MRLCSAGAVCLAIGLSLAAPAGPAAQAAAWPATQFEVVVAEPDMRELLRLDPIDAAAFALDGGVPEGRPVDPLLGTWLTGIGTSFRNAGHLPPKLEPIVDVSGVPTYRTYMFPYQGSGLISKGPNVTAGYYAGCGEDSLIDWGNIVPWLSINRKPAAATGSSQKRFIGSLSHEMMHALGAGDRLGAECNGHSFSVTEGIPNGAAMYIYKQKFPGYTGRISSDRSAVGLRSYAVSLTHGDATPKDQKTQDMVEAGYGTGSLWFFVAERFGGLKIFPQLLQKTLPKNPSEEDVVRWMDDSLQTLDGLRGDSNVAVQRASNFPRQPPGLYEVFPHFVTEFASYGGKRYFSWAGTRFRSQQYARRSWQKFGFSGCPLFTLTPAQLNDTASFTLARNSARCLRVGLQGFTGNVDISMEVISNNLALLDQLHLGWAWKDGPTGDENCYEQRQSLRSKWPPCLYKTFSQTGPSAGKYARSWPLESLDFGAGGGADAERTYIISNIAVQPWTTRTYHDFELKIAATVSTLKGQPAEPVGPLPPRRKSTTAVRPKALAELGREDLYGLQTDPPIRDDTVTGFTVLPYTAGRNQGHKAIVAGGYAVQINDLEYGRTGPILGLVTPTSADAVRDSGVISSIHCRGGALRPIGEVLQSDEDAFRVKIAVPLCKFGPETAAQCETACPVVDRISAELNMAFGWRQFSSTAPTDIVTPGIRRYVGTMPDSWQQAMDFGAGTALPDDGAVDGPQDGTQGAGGTAGAGGVLPGAPCDCSCEERRAFEARAAELKAGAAEGRDQQAALMAMSGPMMACSRQCQREYMICAMEEARQAREVTETTRARREAELTASCDCSCDALQQLLQRSQVLQRAQAAGGSIDLQEVLQLSRCTSACQPQLLQCQMGGG